MGEPIAGRISEEAKDELEHVADKRNVSVSELVGSIVEVWLRDRQVGNAADPDEATPDTFDKSLEEVYDELDAVRWVLESVEKNAAGSNLKPWLQRQVFKKKRGFSELEEPDHAMRTTLDTSGPAGKMGDRS
jgi:hypothetical protein